MPLFAAFRSNAKPPGSALAPASCACPIIEQVTKGCCCSNPEPAPAPKPTEKGEATTTKKKRKSCCSGEHTPEPAAPKQAPKAEPIPTTPAPTAVLTSGRKCSCDRTPIATTAEPAVSPVVESPVSFFPELVRPAEHISNETPPSITHSPQAPPPKA
ncbi:MAG: hypothetical protein U0792_17415 [Gemmataceae bacterium]